MREPPPSSPPPDPGKPNVAIVAHTQAPYRLHVHERIVQEIPEINLYCLYLRQENDQPWRHAIGELTRPVMFGPGQGLAGYRPGREAPKDWRKGGEVVRWLAVHRVQAVLCGGYADAARFRIIRWCHTHRVPCFLTGDSNICGDNATGFKRLAKKLIVKTAVRSVDAVLPFGQRGIEYFERYGARPEQLGFFPYEPDYRLVQEVPSERITAVLRKFALPRERKRLVICGRLAPVKRVDLAIDGLSAIADARPEWDLVVIGDGPLRDILRQRVPEALRGRVCFTGFMGDQAEISALYRGSHVLVHPADFEPWGLVLNEAAAAGMAILSSDVVGAAGDLVRDGMNGRVVRADDLDALVRAMLDITDSANTERYRAGSLAVLADYRKRCDPVRGFRRVLAKHGVISHA
jgi:glycosyltransferase involved in cell wall biosynthesis